MVVKLLCWEIGPLAKGIVPGAGNEDAEIEAKAAIETGLAENNEIYRVLKVVKRK